MMPEPTPGAQSLTFRSWALALLARDERRIRKRKITALLRIVWSVFVRLWISSPRRGSTKVGVLRNPSYTPILTLRQAQGRLFPRRGGRNDPEKEILYSQCCLR